MTAPVHTVTFVATTTPSTFPAGTGPIATYSAKLIPTTAPAIPAQNLDINMKVVFNEVPDDTYTLNIQAFDGTGTAIGAPYTVQIIVADQPVTLNLPTGGTVTIS